MVKLVKCVVCGKTTKTYAEKYFVHCGIRQEFNNSNWLNRPNQAQHINDNEEKAEVEEAQPVIENTKKEVETAEETTTALNDDPQPTPQIHKEEAIEKSDLVKAEEPKELEIVEEVEEEEEKPANPDDYDYRCSKCAELFNKEGNVTAEGLIKCPDCGLECAE